MLLQRHKDHVYVCIYIHTHNSIYNYRHSYMKYTLSKRQHCWKTEMKKNTSADHLQVAIARSLAMVSDTPKGLLDAGVTQLATIAWRTPAFLAVTM